MPGLEFNRQCRQNASMFPSQLDTGDILVLLRQKVHRKQRTSRGLQARQLVGIERASPRHAPPRAFAYELAARILPLFSSDVKALPVKIFALPHLFCA